MLREREREREGERENHSGGTRAVCYPKNIVLKNILFDTGV